MHDPLIFQLSFITRPLKDRPSEADLYVRITIAKDRTEFSLKKRVPLCYWNAQKACIQGCPQLEKNLNPFLDDIRFQVMAAFRRLHLAGKPITPHSIKRTFLGLEDTSHTLCGLVTYHNKNMTEILAPGTLKNYFTTERYLKQFLRQRYRQADLPLAQLNYQFIIEFELFLRRTEPLDPGNPLTNNGIMKHMERLRKMVTMAVKFEWLSKDPFLQYTLKFQKVEKAFLSAPELKRIETKQLKNTRLYLARDLFVFCCYTGLAYTDLANLTPANISTGIDGEPWIHTRRKKTDIPVNMPLLPKAQSILQAYNNDPRALKKGSLFPPLSNQKMNAYLKQIAAHCGLHKPLSFHTARHTFATTITLANGVPIETVSKLLGHTKLTTTQIYARVLEQKIRDDMHTLRQKLK